MNKKSWLAMLLAILLVLSPVTTAFAATSEAWGERYSVRDVEDTETQRISGVFRETSEAGNLNHPTEQMQTPQIQLFSIRPVEPTRTYIYQVDGIEQGRQIVKNGETLLKPASPKKEGTAFQGWFDKAGNECKDFGSKISLDADSGNREIVLEAKFKAQVHVFFMDLTSEPERVFRTKAGAPGTKISTDDVRPASERPYKTIQWYLDKNLTGDPVGDNVKLGSENLTLWPKVEFGHYVIYETGAKASVQESDYLYTGDKTQKPEKDPVREGYRFKYWSLEQDGEEYSFGNEIEKDTTVYAVWEKLETSYTVLFWGQKVTDDKDAADSEKTYELYEKEVRYAMAEEEVGLLDADKQKGAEENVYRNFHFNAENSLQGTVPVDGDGSTVLNVYYDRNLMHLILVPKEGEKTEMTGLYEQPLEKYGYSMPLDPFFWYFNYNGRHQPYWSYTFDYNNIKINDENFTYTTRTNYPYDTLTIYEEDEDKQPYGSHQLLVFRQDLNGQYSTPPEVLDRMEFDARLYLLPKLYGGFTQVAYAETNAVEEAEALGLSWFDHEYEQTIIQDAKELDWIKLSPSRWKFVTPWGNLYLLHERNKYTLTLTNPGEEDKEQDVYYEMPLKEVLTEEPTRPADIPEDHAFLGWCYDQECKDPVDLETLTMPIGGLHLYARWGLATMHVRVFADKDATEPMYTIEKPYKTQLLKRELPTIKNAKGEVMDPGQSTSVIQLEDKESWQGWMVKEGDAFISYDFSKPITQDFDIYAHKTPIGEFKLNYSYEDDAGETKTLLDPQTYATGAHARVMDVPSDVTTRQFFSWNTEADGTGEDYRPNDSIEMNGNRTLYAVWGEKPKTVEIVYHGAEGALEDGNKEVTIKPLDNNVIHKVLANTVGNGLGFIRDGYVIVAWEYELNGKKIQVKPGDQILVDDSTEGSNVLTAVWEEKKKGMEHSHDTNQISIEVAKVWDDDDNAERKRPSAVEIKLIANGEDTGRRLILDAETDWTGRFEHLESVKDGKSVVYTVEEANVAEGYTSDVSGDAVKGYVVTNRYNEEEKEPEKTMPVVPSLERVVIPAVRIPRAGIGR